MRLTILLAALALTGAASSQGIFLEENTYRSGGMYKVMRGSTPEACAVACAQDRACGSFSFIVYDSNIQAPRCELKAGIGIPERDPSAISGISPAHEANFLEPVSAEYVARNTEGGGELMGGSDAPAPRPTAKPVPRIEYRMPETPAPAALAPEVRTVTPKDEVPSYSVQREPAPIVREEE